MRGKFLFAAAGVYFFTLASPSLRADQLEMQNGDRYFGKVLTVSSDAVVLQSEVLGKITVPRKKVSSLVFGANFTASTTAARHTVVSTSLPTAALSTAPAATNADLSAALRNLAGNTNLMRQIRTQMLAGSPEAAAKYDELVNGLMDGKLNLNDIRRQARSSANQVRQLKHDLGPDAGDSLDVYLDILDGFLRETANEPAASPSASQSGAPSR